MPKISILSPAYNHEKYVKQAIDSVLRQTLSDFELIIADDASTDSTADKILEFKDERITLLRNSKNQGTVATSAACYERCQGEYIVMLATDDIFEPNMLEILAGFLDNNPDALAVFGSANCIDDNGNILPEGWTDVGIGKDRFTHLRQLFQLQHPFCSIAGMFRRSTLETFGYFPRYLRQTNDMAHHIRILFHGAMPIIPNKVLRYRWQANKGNVSSRTPENDARLDFELFAILDLFRENINSPEVLRQIFPEINNHPWPLNEMTVHFHLAQLAISFFYPAHQLFGLHLLYQLLKNKKTADYLETNCNFTYIDFFQLAGKKPTIMDFGLYNQNSELLTRLKTAKNELNAAQYQLADASSRLEHIPPFIIRFFGRTHKLISIIKKSVAAN